MRARERDARRAEAAAALSAIIATLMFHSCATPVRMPAGLDPSAVLPPGALVTVEADREGVALLAPALLPEGGAVGAAALAARTRKAAIGLYARAADGADAGRFRADMAIAGDYPWRQAAFALSADRSWKRRAVAAPSGGRPLEAWASAASGIEVALPGPGLALASTGAVDDLVASLSALAAGAPARIPAAAPAPEEASVRISVPEPFSRLGETLLGQSIDIPCRALLVSFSPEPPPAGGGERMWTAAVTLVMASEDDARIYRPAARLAWLFAARALLPGAARPLNFTATSNALCATGLEFGESALRAAVAALAVRGPGPAADGTAPAP